MKINSVLMKSFKNHPNVGFDLAGQLIKITGKNGAGKSSVAEAIVFCLYGRNLQGSNQNLDTLIMNGSPGMNISVVLEDGSSISRSKTPRNSLLLFEDGSQKKEDSQITQEILVGNIIPPLEDFLNVFTPGYFMRSFPRKRELLEELTPKIDISQFINKKDEEYLEQLELSGSARQILEKAKEIKSEKTKDIKAEKSVQEYLESRLTPAILNRDPEVVKQEIEKKTQEFKKDKKKLQEWTEYLNEVQDIKELKISTADATKRIKKLKSKLNAIGEKPPSREGLNKINEEIILLKGKFIQELPGKCPTCEQKIPKKIIDKIKNHNKALTLKIEEMTAEKEKLEKQIEEKEKVYEALAKQNRDIEMEINREERIANEPIPTLPNKIDKVDFNEEDLESRFEKINQQRAEFKDFSDYKHAESLVNRLEADLEKIEYIIKRFGATGIPKSIAAAKFKTINEELKVHFDNAKIVTFQKLKRGVGYKEVFDIEINDKPYDRLSFGEKIKVDIVMSQLLSRLYKENKKPPHCEIMFIDNSDLLDEISREKIFKNMGKNLQVIYTKVTNNSLDKKLIK